MIYTPSSGSGGSRVVVCSKLAQQLGVFSGMSLAEAQALLHPTLLVEHKIPLNQPTAYEPADHELDRERLHKLAHSCQRFTPHYGVDDSPSPESLLLDLTGCTHLFGGETAMAVAIVEDFRERDFQVRVGLAPTWGAAWAAARYLGNPSESYQVILTSQLTAKLSPLPIEALRLPPTTITMLHELGIRTLGQVRSLPRSTLPARFGPLLLKRLNQAWGDEQEILSTETYHEPLVATWVGEFPLLDQQCLKVVCGALLDQLLERLRPRREGVRTLRCGLRDTKGCLEELIVGFAAATDHRKHLFDIFCLNCERLSLSPEIIWVQLEILQAEVMAIHQRNLFGQVLNEDHHKNVSILLDRLSSRLGAEAVVRPVIQPEAQPEFAVIYEACTQVSVDAVSPAPGSSPTKTGKKGGEQKRPRTSLQAAPDSPPYWKLWTLGRPTRLLVRPQLIEVSHAGPEGAPFSFWWSRCEQRVIRSWGPERIETGWWRESSIRRDYFRVEVHTGHHYWLFHDLRDFKWFLHGMFD